MTKYDEFIQAYQKAYPNVRKQLQYEQAIKIWQDLKAKPEDFDERFRAKMTELKVLRMKNNSQSMKSFTQTKLNFGRAMPALAQTNPEIKISTPINADAAQGKKSVEAKVPERSYETPAQDKLEKEIAALYASLASKRQMRDSGMSDVSTSELVEIDKQIKSKEKMKKIREKNASVHREKRAKFKEAIQTISEKDEESGNLLKSFNRKSVGRPRLEEDQPELLNTIMDIVQMNSSADARRRSEILRSCTTLDDLWKELQNRGFKISRSPTYFRLHPRRGDSKEGLRRVQTVPVKLLRPENSLRKENADRMYAKSLQNDMQSVDALFGPDVILYLSNDDKARINLGVTAANKQSSILMNMNYKVRLLDHDFVVAPRHKLIPSVYAVCNLDLDGSMTYSGETFIRVRSGKHDSSTAFSHLYDMKELFESQAIPTKPILLISTDGAQDEAPRFPKPLRVAVFLFKSLNLDVYIHATNAAGLSAFNPVERSMAPLTHDLVGLVLQHDIFGSHLDSSGKTIDEELEEKNFYAASEVLSNVWSKTIINDFKVDCKPVEKGCHFEPDELDQEWVARHVLQTRYFLMIVKCVNQKCCKPFTTNWLNIFPKRFFPAPAVYKFGQKGLYAVEPSEYVKNTKNFKFATLKDRLIAGLLPKEAENFTPPPFDLYCPSMMPKLSDCICEKCGHYWPCEAAKKRHAKIHKHEKFEVEHGIVLEEVSDEFCQIQEPDAEFENSELIPVIENVQEFLRSPFTEDLF